MVPAPVTIREIAIAITPAALRAHSKRRTFTERERWAAPAADAPWSRSVAWPIAPACHGAHGLLLARKY
jgi:hypothetical protein